MGKGFLQGTPFTVHPIPKGNDDNSINLGNKTMPMENIGTLSNNEYRIFKYNGKTFYFKNGQFFYSNRILVDKKLHNELWNYVYNLDKSKRNKGDEW